MAEWQSSQGDSAQPGDSATPGQAADQGLLPGLQTEEQAQGGQGPWQDAQGPQDGQQAAGQSQYQQVQPFVPAQRAVSPNSQVATGLTPAQQFWYVLQCIYFGMGYLAKVPAKKALQDYGMAQLTSAEQFWYVVECIFFGMGYFAKLPTAKAVSEMPQFQAAGIR